MGVLVVPTMTEVIFCVLALLAMVSVMLLASPLHVPSAMFPTEAWVNPAVAFPCKDMCVMLEPSKEEMVSVAPLYMRSS